MCHTEEARARAGKLKSSCRHAEQSRTERRLWQEVHGCYRQEAIVTWMGDSAGGAPARTVGPRQGPGTVPTYIRRPDTVASVLALLASVQAEPQPGGMVTRY